MSSSNTRNKLPQLDTVHNIAEAEAYKEAGTEKQANSLRQNVYNRARSRIAQEISGGAMSAYLRNPNGEVSALPAEHELMKQIRSFLADGIKTKPRYSYNEITRQQTRSRFDEVINLEWVKRLYIPVDANSPDNQAPTAQPEINKASPAYPPELDIALQAWRAVSATEGKGKPKARIIEWLGANPEVWKEAGRKPSNEAKQRIATVANWEKEGGATSTE